MSRHKAVAVTGKRNYRIPTLPNFVMDDRTTQWLPLCDLSDDELSAIAQAWAVEFVLKGQRRRAALTERSNP